MKYILIITFFSFIQLNLSGQDSGGSDDQKGISVGEIIKLKSAILSETRDIYVHKPQGFWGMDDQMSHLPVVYVLDGESQFLNTLATVDFLSSAPLGNDLIPRAIVVGIPNKNRNLTPIKGIIANDPRTLEITGGGVEFLNFITEELIPFIDSNYSTTNHRTIIGHSLGGLITFEALMRKRNFFDNYISIDPALGFTEETYMKEVLDTLSQSNLSKENLFFSAANTRSTFLTQEDLLTDDSDVMKLIDIANRKFLNSIDSTEWKINLTSKYYPDENHFSIPQRSTYDALRSFYDYYSFSEILDYYHPKYSSRDDLVERIKDHYEMITNKIGFDVVPMEGYLNSYAFGMDQSGRAEVILNLTTSLSH